MAMMQCVRCLTVCDNLLTIRQGAQQHYADGVLPISACMLFLILKDDVASCGLRGAGDKMNSI